MRLAVSRFDLAGPDHWGLPSSTNIRRSTSLLVAKYSPQVDSPIRIPDSCVNTTLTLLVIYGVYLVSELQVKRHVNKVLHRSLLQPLQTTVSTPWNLVIEQVMAHLVTALILSGLDYCNSVLIDLHHSLYNITSTTCSERAGASCSRSHITPALR